MDLKSVRVSSTCRRRFAKGSPTAPTRMGRGQIWLHARHTDGASRRADAGSPARYTAEVSMRDGSIYVQKRSRVGGRAATCRRGHLLPALGAGQPAARIGEWERVGGVARDNPDGSVTIQVIRAARSRSG